MGIIDVAQSVGGAIGLQAKFKPFHNYATDNYFKDRALKLQEDKYDQEKLGNAQKDWVVDWKNVDKIDIPRVQQAAAAFSTKWSQEYAKNKESIRTPEYYNDVNALVAMKNEAYNNKAGLDSYRKTQLDHPDSLAWTNKEAQAAYEANDPTAWQKAIGGTAFDINKETRPNVDMTKVVKEIADVVAADGSYENPLPGEDKYMAGHAIVKEKMTRNPDKVITAAHIKYMGSPTLQAQFPDEHEYTTQVLDGVAAMDFKRPKLVALPKSDSGDGFGFGIGGGNNGRFAVERTQEPTKLGDIVVRIPAPQEMIDKIAADKDGGASFLAEMEKRGIGTPEERAALVNYATSTNKVVDGKILVPPKLTFPKYNSDLKLDDRFNLQQIASGENKKLSWNTYSSAIDAATSQPIKGNTVEGELMDVIHVSGGKVNKGWYARLYDKETKRSILIPYNKAATEIKTYTVGKNGKQGFSLYDMGVLTPSSGSASVKETNTNLAPGESRSNTGSFKGKTDQEILDNLRKQGLIK